MHSPRIKDVLSMSSCMGVENDPDDELLLFPRAFLFYKNSQQQKDKQTMLARVSWSKMLLYASATYTTLRLIIITQLTLSFSISICSQMQIADFDQFGSAFVALLESRTEQQRPATTKVQIYAEWLQHINNH